VSKQQYHWENNSLIKNAIFESPKLGDKRALLFIEESADTHEALKKGREELLTKHKINSYPDYIDGRHVLVVNKYKDEKALKSALNNIGFTNGVGFSKSLGKEDAPSSFKEKLNHLRHGTTLKIAGFLGLIGHGLMMRAGIMEGDSSKKAASIKYMVNSGLYATFGNGAEQLKVDPIIDRMRTHLADNNIYIEPTEIDVTNSSYKDNQSIFKKAYNLVGKNVIQINEGIGLWSNIDQMASGMGKGGNGTKSVPFFLAGFSSAIGSIAAIALPEVKKEEQNPALQKNIFGRAFSWVQEAPLRFLGLTTVVGNISFFFDVFEKKKRQSSILNGGTDKDGKKLLSHSERIKNNEAALMKRAKKVTGKSVTNIKQLEKFIDKGSALHIGEKDKRGNLLRDDSFESLHKLKQELKVAKLGKQAWMVPLGMAIVYAGATLGMLLTFKNRAEDKDPERQYGEVFARAALNAIQVPEGVQRDRAVSLMGMSLFTHKDVKGLTAEEITQHITKRIEKMEQSPWAKLEANPLLVSNEPVVENAEKKKDAPVRTFSKEKQAESFKSAVIQQREAQALTEPTRT